MLRSLRTRQFSGGKLSTDRYSIALRGIGPSIFSIRFKSTPDFKSKNDRSVYILYIVHITRSNFQNYHERYIPDRARDLLRISGEMLKFHIQNLLMLIEKKTSRFSATNILLLILSTNSSNKVPSVPDFPQKPFHMVSNRNTSSPKNVFTEKK